jgi:DNA-binding response OmpR family regulator
MAMKSSAFLEYASAAQFQALHAAGVTLFPESDEVFVGSRNVRCNRTQFRLLSALLEDFCRTVSYERLMHTNGRPLSANEQNVLKVQLCHLRRLLRLHGAAIEIRNIYGYGYQARPQID